MINKTPAQWLCGLLLSLFASLALAQLKPGTAAPDFSAPAALAGQTFTFSLDAALKKGPVVLYFYPKAFTTGCTIEAKLFAEVTDQFTALNTTVIGVSGDDIATLQKFSLGPCGGKFAVAADLDRHIMKAYDAALTIKPDMADRISYVITPDKKILFMFDSLNPDQHVSKTLQAVQAWQKRAK